MSSYPSSLTFKRNIDCQVWQQLAELWSSMVARDETQLFTEDTLIKLLENRPEKHSSQQSETDRFFLLISAKFNALLYREQNIVANQISLIFAPTEIIDRLIAYSHKQQWDLASIGSLQTVLKARLSKNKDGSADLMAKTLRLLANNIEETEPERSNYSPSRTENLLQYQVQQERIFEQIEIQIGQNLNPSEIVQTAIERSCKFLELDRLLVYQLGVPIEPTSTNNETVRTVDTIAYEARRSDEVPSTLYFQEGECWSQQSKCRHKYRQGFGLVINDINHNSNLDPCLESLMIELQVRAKVVTPIIVREQLWGLIIAHQSQPKVWQHQDVQFLRQLAEYLAIAIFNHQSYRQLQQQKKLLEKQVEIQAQQLRDALLAAEAASKSKHDFLGSMSHELRTPLTCVIGLSSTLLQWSSTKAKIRLSPEKQHEYLHLIQQSGKQLLGLINNILEFSDVESGKHLLDIRPVSLSEVAKYSLQLLQESAANKDIKLISQFKVEAQQDIFFADEIRLKEIIFHILNNGIKFTSEGGEVIFRTWRERHQVIFQIEDTGIGIDPEEIPFLFEKFKQIEQVHQRVHGGTGLGLALTKKLVELHGGTIEVESAIGAGSVFTVYLPEKTPHEEQPHSLTSNANITPRKGSQTIALITEDEASATFICQLLNTIDYQVVWLIDSAMAVSQIELLQPKIVIIDRDCSVTDVQNVVRAISHASLSDYTQVTLLCERFEHDEWQKFTKCGVDEYLLKSMNPTQIINKINNLSQTPEVYEQIQDG